MLCWVNGAPEESLSVRDRGLAYGDGLFETIAVRGGTAALLAGHLARVQVGCQRLLMPLDIAQLEAELVAFCQALGEGVAKLIITRGQGPRGYTLPAPCSPMRILQSAPLPAYPALNREQGVRLFPCATRLAEQPLLAGLKHLNRLEQVLARAEWQGGDYAEGLMRDTQGRVVEGVFSNLFIVSQGQLLTPVLSRCGVAGVMRAEIIQRAQALGIAVQVCDIGYEQLLSADEVMLCNSQYGIWPVRELAGVKWPVGPITQRLQHVLKPLLGH